MPIDTQTGQALPYEGEPGFEESAAANPEAYMDDAEGRLDAATALLGAAEEEEAPITEDVDPEETTDPEIINTVFQYMNGRAPDMEDPKDISEVQLIDSIIDGAMQEKLESQEISIVDVVLEIHRARDMDSVPPEQPGQASEEVAPETFFS